jgi:hypothetical protein
MSSDRSRSTDRYRSGYTGPVAQQGRVILDRDFNALQGLTAARIEADALDFVGPCGTPDDGFRIGLPDANLSPPAFWYPPESPPASLLAEFGSSIDFLISPGTMYIGGQRVHFPGTQQGNAITYSYFDQPDWPDPPPPVLDNAVRDALIRQTAFRELAFLDVTEQEVSAVEDPDLLEVALGGPDTTQRLKLLRRVKRRQVVGSTCVTAWQSAINEWRAQGLDFDPATMRLLPAARLQVGFTNDASTGNPCDPVATGGYLYADNQLIRVRVARSGATQNLVWGYDNASFLYRITAVSPDGTALTLAGGPPDDFHKPQRGQVVEILTTAAVLGIEPDETDPTGQSTILRVAAEANGKFFQLSQPYGPATPGAATNSIVLSQALPTSISGAIQGGTLPCFVRIWQAQVPLQPLGTPTTLADPTTGISTGITVTLTSATQVIEGAYWMIAARPATPQGVYPEDLLTAPQPPDGPRRWVCPLAVIDWSGATGPTVTDCRNVFDGLVALTKRKPGCCTVGIAPSDVTSAATLQNLIDSAAASAATVTVCLSAGEYALSAPLRLDSRHARMTIESCGGAALLLGAAADMTVFADGLLVLAGAQNVALRGLSLEPPLVDSAASDESPNGSRTCFGIRAVDAQNLTLERCTVGIVPDANSAADTFGVCVFLQGNCSGLMVQNCRFASTIPPTFTPLEVQAEAAAPAPVAAPAPAPAPAPAAGRARARVAAAATPAPAKAKLAPAASEFDQLFSAATTSPPLSMAAMLAESASAARAMIVTNRQAVVAAPVPNKVVVTVGVLAAAYAESEFIESSLLCELGVATVRDSTFAGLTFATWLSAAATTLRLQDNTVSRGIAGLWLELPGAANVPALKGTQGQFPQIVGFEEFVVLRRQSAAVKPPTPSVQSSAAPVPVQTVDVSGILQSALPAEFTLFVLGNQVQVGTPPRKGAAIINSSAALLCALYVLEPVEEQAASAVIIASNRLRSVAGFATALLTLPATQPCAITGNVIVNEGGTLDQKTGAFTASPSLWLVLPESPETISLLSASGNALQGRSDLTVLTRTVAAARHGWSPYNADPT